MEHAAVVQVHLQWINSQNSQTQNSLGELSHGGFCLCFPFISTSELIQSFLRRSHYTHQEHLNNSAGLKGIKTTCMTFFKAQFGLVVGKWVESHCRGEL